MSPNIQRPRVGLDADGLVRIYCRDCGELICRQVYRGFSTAQCAVCFAREHGLPVPEPPPEQADIALASLYNTGETTREEEKEKFGMLRYMFRAIGFFRKKAPVPAIESVKESKRKQRKPLLSQLDEGEAQKED